MKMSVVLMLFVYLLSSPSVSGQANKQPSRETKTLIDQQMREKIARDQSMQELTVEVTFNKTQDIEALMALKSALYGKGILLTYRKIHFDEKGKLTAIAYSVDCNNNAGGQDEIDKLSETGSDGFVCYLAPNAKYKVFVGNVREAGRPH